MAPSHHGAAVEAAIYNQCYRQWSHRPKRASPAATRISPCPTPVSVSTLPHGNCLINPGKGGLAPTPTPARMWSLRLHRINFHAPRKFCLSRTSKTKKLVSGAGVATIGSSLQFLGFSLSFPTPLFSKREVGLRRSDNEGIPWFLLRYPTGFSSTLSTSPFPLTHVFHSHHRSPRQD
jgi:hypothetical protein